MISSKANNTSGGSGWFEGGDDVRVRVRRDCIFENEAQVFPKWGWRANFNDMSSKVTSPTTSPVVISPEEYVNFCLSRSKYHDLHGAELRVVGHVDLTKIQGGRGVFTLRRAIIEGDIVADGTCELSTIEDCVVEGECTLDKSKLSHVKRNFHAKGDFSAKECTRLQFLGGRYDGGLNLEDACIRRLEKGLICKGELRLSGCRVQRLNCQVDGDVVLCRSEVREFGPDFRVGGDLWISDCRNLHKLGHVGTPNNVDIFGFGLTRISKEFSCRGVLRVVSNHSIENISPEIKIGGLRLRDTGLVELDLPNIEGDVRIDKCEDMKRIKIGGKGKVELERCMVDNIDHVGNEAKSVKFENCWLVREVGGTWKGDVTFDDMRGLENIQTSFECGGNFRAWSCLALQNIGGTVGGDALVSCCDSMKSLDADFSVGGNLRVVECRYGGLSVGCRVGGDLKVFASSVSSTSDTMRVEGNADLSREDRLKYMRGFVGGDLNVDGSQIVSLEEDLEVRGDISAKGCHSLTKIDCEVGGKILATGKRVNRAGGKNGAKLSKGGTAQGERNKILPKCGATKGGLPTSKIDRQVR